eukprot:2514620-Pyramimonas_sp.AAC.1
MCIRDRTNPWGGMPELLCDAMDSGDSIDYNDPWAKLNDASDTRDSCPALLKPNRCRDVRCPSGWASCCYRARDADADGCEDDGLQCAVYYREQSNTYAYRFPNDDLLRTGWR